MHKNMARKRSEIGMPVAMPTQAEPRAAVGLKEALAQGKHWYVALLEAVGQWELDHEEAGGLVHHYLIEGEALDWPLLAQRLCRHIEGVAPGNEMSAFLADGRPPLDIPRPVFRQLLGGAKYRAYLNYYYGVEVETALQKAVEAEVLKEAMPFHRYKRRTAGEEGFERVYGVSRDRLLRRFREERGLAQENGLSGYESKAFTYWLFKYRISHNDPARVASDTRKGLAYLWQHRHRLQPGAPIPMPPFAIAPGPG